jgi:hypothetical protein
MELFTKLIRHFLDLQEIMNTETWKIVRPIIEEVERQGEEVLLFPPVRGTFWTEWLVKPTKGIPTERYRHLMLMVYLAPFSELYLVLIERYVGKPDEFNREIFTQHYRAGRLPYDQPPFFKVMKLKENGVDEREKGSYSDFGLDELARFPIKAKNKPKAVAERIVSEAQRIHGSKRQSAGNVTRNAKKEG